MIQIVYHLIVFFLTIHIIWFVFKEKKIWNQLGGVLVLIIFLLRLLLIK